MDKKIAKRINDVAAHLFWLLINLIDCHRINRYNDISIEKVPEHLSGLTLRPGTQKESVLYCPSGRMHRDSPYSRVRMKKALAEGYAGTPGEEAGGASSGGGEGAERAAAGHEGAGSRCGEFEGGDAQAGRGEDFRV